MKTNTTTDRKEINAKKNIPNDDTNTSPTAFVSCYVPNTQNMNVE